VFTIKVKGLNGKTYSWKMPKRKPNKISNLQNLAKNILTEELPLAIIYEEVSLPGSGEIALRADIYVKDRNLIIETHGRQHYEYIPFFSKNKLNYLKIKHNDNLKKDWCELNKINYLELPYNDTNSWRQYIREAIGKR
jgi:hypothetical protein